MKRILSLVAFTFLTTSCGNVNPSGTAPSTLNDYHPPVYAPGTCILGTASNCLTVIPTPAPPPVAVVVPSMQSPTIECKNQIDRHIVDCTITGVRNEAGVTWVSHVRRLAIDWGDSDILDHHDGLFVEHIYADARSYGWGMWITDDRGVTVYAYGSISTLPIN